MSAFQLYTLVIIEDEPPILENIVQKVNSLALPVQIVGTAINGQCALELIEKVSPDIVITDIRMPGMDGLSLCQQLHEQHPAIRTIILSGYSEFEYAQTAISYHVFDYLLKPVNVQKLCTTLEKVCNEIQRSQKQTSHQALVRQLSGTPDGIFSSLPQLQSASFSLCLICLGNLLDHGATAGTPEHYIQYWESAALDRFMDHEAPAFWQLIVEKNPNEQMLLTTGAQPDLPRRLFLYLNQRLSQDVCVNICVAEKAVGYDAIWPAAREMRSALRRTLVPCASNIFLSNILPTREYIIPLRQSMQSAAKSGSSSRFKTTLHAWLEALRSKNIPQQALEAELMALLWSMESQQNISPISKKAYQTCCMNIASAHDLDMLYVRLEEVLCDAYTQINDQKLSTESLAAVVKTYLDTHYREEITMETLSKQFHFSESYITRLFRTQYNTPPMKYLLWRRIERAKELIIQNPDMGFGTVAELIGYCDQHYFSRLFRISTGMSPSEYRAAAPPK